MSGGPPKRDSQKTRQELLDEIYLLRDVAGERDAKSRSLAEQLAQQSPLLDRVRTELARTHAALDDTRAELGRTHAALDDTRAELGRVLLSHSWRLTAPLRAVVRWLRWRNADNRSPPRMVVEQAAPVRVAATSGVVDRRVGDQDRRFSAQVSIDTTTVPEPNPDLVTLAPAAVERAPPQPTLYVDITEVVTRHGKTGVQRVTREILRALLAAPPAGYAVLPVAAETGGPYREIAHVWQDNPARGDLIVGKAGDVFLGLDHAMQAVVANADALAAMHARGARLWFVCNDTLPLDHPEWFPDDVAPLFKRWFQTVIRVGDGVACISRATEACVNAWASRLPAPRARPLVTGVFALGADSFAADGGNALTPADHAALDALPQCPLFLMVGTIEPRKGHAQALEAFNALWDQGEDVALVIVGFPGWMTEVVQRRVRHHELFGKCLFWFMDASDALVEALYGKCTCLLAASEGEGFGLPLVEAARHDLPILCRDLPVFHEVASARATYFSGLTPDALATATGNWLDAYRRGQATASAGPATSTWVESANQLLDLILHGTHAIVRPD